MRPSRKHAEILLASLVFVGSLMWTILIARHTLQIGSATLLGLRLAGGFVGAHVARRWLVSITAGELAISALVACAGVLGAIAARAGDPPNVRMLLMLAAVEAGAWLGAWTSRRQTAEAGDGSVRAIWRVLGAGLAGYGALLLAIGIAIVISKDDHVVLAAVIGTLTTSALVVRFTSATPANCALGIGLSIGSVAVVNATVHGFGNLIGMIVLGFAVIGCVAGIGGRIGRWLRPTREPAPELPGAKVHGSQR